MWSLNTARSFLSYSLFLGCMYSSVTVPHMLRTGLDYVRQHFHSFSVFRVYVCVCRYYWKRHHLYRDFFWGEQEKDHFGWSSVFMWTRSKTMWELKLPATWFSSKLLICWQQMMLILFFNFISASAIKQQCLGVCGSLHTWENIVPYCQFHRIGFFILWNIYQNY